MDISDADQIGVPHGDAQLLVEPAGEGHHPAADAADDGHHDDHREAYRGPQQDGRAGDAAHEQYLQGVEEQHPEARLQVPLEGLEVVLEKDAVPQLQHRVHVLIESDGGHAHGDDGQRGHQVQDAQYQQVVDDGQPLAQGLVGSQHSSILQQIP